MAVKIRLARRGRKKQVTFDVVVADGRSPRDGKFIEKIGTYNPNTDPATININEESAFNWVMKGAQPTDTVRAMLSYRGILLKKHLQIGVIKGAMSQEEADEKYQAWLAAKDAQIEGKVARLQKEKEEKRKTQLAAESKVKEARAEALKKKNVVEEEGVAPAAKKDEEVTPQTDAPEAVGDTPEAVAEEKPVVVEQTDAEDKKEENKAD